MLDLELEITDINNKYSDLIFNLNLIYERLEDLRENLPHMFLTKKGIKEYIEKNNESRDLRIQNIDSEILDLKTKFKNEKDISKKRNLKRLIEKYTIRKNFIQENKLSSSDLDDYFYENLILLSSEGRNQAVSSYKKSIVINSQIQRYSKYYAKKLQLEGSEEFFKGKVSNVTESLKRSFVESHDGLLKLDLLCAETNSLEKSLDQLIKQFEFDIGNFRRFYEKNKPFTF